MISGSTVLRRVLATASIASLVTLAACAHKEPPVAEMAIARTSVASAESAGALQQSPKEFLSAREKLARAETASRDKNYEDARRLAEEAAADANVAERRARAVKSAQTAEELRRANSTLANELSRGNRP